MGWLISIGLIISSLIYKNIDLLIPAGLFAISGSLGIWLNKIANEIRDSKNKKE